MRKLNLNHTPFSNITSKAIVFISVLTLAFLCAVAQAASVSTTTAPAAASAQQGAVMAMPPAQTAAHAQAQEVIIRDISGEVMVREAGSTQWVPAEPGRKLLVSDSVKTGDAGGAQIHFDGKAVVFLAPGTELTVETAIRDQARTRNTLLKLEVGKLRARIDKLKDGATFEIKTPTAIAAVRGTDLYLTVYQLAEAAAKKITELYVDEGSVDFAAVMGMLESIVVDRFGASSIANDGTILPLRHLSTEERDEFVNNFHAAITSGGNPQIALEQMPIGSAPGTGNAFLGQLLSDAFEDALNEALADKDSEQGVNGGSGQDGGSTGGDGGSTGPSQADLNRQAIQDQIDHVDGVYQDAQSMETDQRLLVDGADAIAEGPADSGGWDYQTLNTHFDDGVVADERTDYTGHMDQLLDGSNQNLAALESLKTQDSLTQSLSIKTDAVKATRIIEPSTVDELGNIDVRIAELDRIFRDANATDDNDHLVTEADDAAAMADDSLAQIQRNGRAMDDDFAALESLRAQERQKLKGVLDSVLDNQQELLVQAQVERTFDAQTGKVFVDAFGNRVRTDQYVFHENGSDTVKFLSLTLRTGQYQPGVSSVSFETVFNREIDPSESANGGLRQLPWGDYFNVVTREEMADALGIDEYIYDQELRGFVYNPDFEDLYSEYIVHENNPGLAMGNDALFPMDFLVDCRGPQDEGGERDRIMFIEEYNEPFEVEIGDNDVPVQGLEWDATIIAPRYGDELAIVHERGEGGWDDDYFYINGEEVEGEYNYEGGDGSQTPGFADDPNIPDLQTDDGINYYRNESDGIYPAHFEENMWIDGDSHVLIGIFLPIDNSGQVVPGSAGFDVQGPRDILKPNSLVNGGNYNLQVILAYGHDVPQEGGLVDDGYEGYNDLFVEDFRIDMIITPEIFQPYDIIGSTALFPDTLNLDDFE